MGLQLPDFAVEKAAEQQEFMQLAGDAVLVILPTVFLVAVGLALYLIYRDSFKR